MAAVTNVASKLQETCPTALGSVWASHRIDAGDQTINRPAKGEVSLDLSLHEKKNQTHFRPRPRLAEDHAVPADLLDEKDSDAKGIDGCAEHLVPDHSIEQFGERRFRLPLERLRHPTVVDKPPVAVLPRR